jgi:hypothetical protein
VFGRPLLLRLAVRGLLLARRVVRHAVRFDQGPFNTTWGCVVLCIRGWVLLGVSG